MTVADLAARVQANLHPAIKELQEKISLEMAGNLNDCQEHYVAGLSDALGIIIKHLKDELEVGKSYYVIMPEDETTNKIVKMRLYKITQKQKLYYSFTADSRLKYPSNDLTLSNPQSIKMRIFDNEEEAERNKDIMIWRRELRNPFGM